MDRRSVIGLVSGAVLGIFCILGVYFRMGARIDGLFLLATWLNRVIMGMMIGFFTPVSKKIMTSALRGAALGLIVSLSFYIATEFLDLAGFIAGHCCPK